MTCLRGRLHSLPDNFRIISVFGWSSYACHMKQLFPGGCSPVPRERWPGRLRAAEPQCHLLAFAFLLNTRLTGLLAILKVRLNVRKARANYLFSWTAAVILLALTHLLGENVFGFIWKSSQKNCVNKRIWYGWLISSRPALLPEFSPAAAVSC